MRRKASGAGRNCCQFAHLEPVCVKVYPVDPQWDSNEKEALGLVKHQPRLPSAAALLWSVYQGMAVCEWEDDLLGYLGAGVGGSNLKICLE